jgi:hypothetical protein
MKRDYRLYVVIGALILIPVSVVILLWQFGYFAKKPSAPASGTNATGYTCTMLTNFRGVFVPSLHVFRMTFNPVPAACAGETSIDIRIDGNLAPFLQYTLTPGMTTFDIPVSVLTKGRHSAEIKADNANAVISYQIE